MRCLVTGGAGFIGSHLVDRLLAEGHAVDVVDDLSVGALSNLSEARSDPAHEFTFSRLDVRSEALLDLMTRRRPDVVFHLAAQGDVRTSVQRPVFDADVNVLGSLNVLEGARAAGARKVVFASSGVALYGELDESDLPAKETLPQRPQSPFGVAKKAVADYLAAYRELHGLEYTVLALSNVYGPRQDPVGEGGVVAVFAERLLAGAACVIVGDGSQTRDFVYVDDVVDAFARAAEKGGGLLLNVGTGTETSVGDLHRAMARVMGLDPAGLPVEHAAPTSPGELMRSCLDPSRAGNYLGWKPWTPLDEGVREVLRWFSERGPRRGA